MKEIWLEVVGRLQEFVGFNFRQEAERLEPHFLPCPGTLSRTGPAEGALLLRGRPQKLQSLLGD